MGEKCDNYSNGCGCGRWREEKKAQGAVREQVCGSVYPNVTECIVRVQGHDTLTFFFLSSFLFFDWAEVL